MSYSQITWYIVTAFALSTGAVALGTGASLMTALSRGVIAMLLLGTLGWVANVFLLAAAPAQTTAADKGRRLDATIGDEPHAPKGGRAGAAAPDGKAKPRK